MNTVKVADEVFLATALLHRENPDREDFTVSETEDRAARENLFGGLRPGVRVHDAMLYATGENTRRLLRASDDVDPQCRGRMWPHPKSVPARYRELIDWAKEQYSKHEAPELRWLEGISRLRGLGRELWKGEDPDEYVGKLREGWE